LQYVDDPVVRYFPDFCMQITSRNIRKGLNYLENASRWIMQSIPHAVLYCTYLSDFYCIWTKHTNIADALCRLFQAIKGHGYWELCLSVLFPWLSTTSVQNYVTFCVFSCCIPSLICLCDKLVYMWYFMWLVSDELSHWPLTLSPWPLNGWVDMGQSLAKVFDALELKKQHVWLYIHLYLSYFANFGITLVVYPM
jgi:hypothetical protein